MPLMSLPSSSSIPLPGFVYDPEPDSLCSIVRDAVYVSLSVPTPDEYVHVTGPPDSVDEMPVDPPDPITTGPEKYIASDVPSSRNAPTNVTVELDTESSNRNDPSSKALVSKAPESNAPPTVIVPRSNETESNELESNAAVSNIYAPRHLSPLVPVPFTVVAFIDSTLTSSWFATVKVS